MNNVKNGGKNDIGRKLHVDGIHIRPERTGIVSSSEIRNVFLSFPNSACTRAFPCSFSKSLIVSMAVLQIQQLYETFLTELRRFGIFFSYTIVREKYRTTNFSLKNQKHECSAS